MRHLEIVPSGYPHWTSASSGPLRGELTVPGDKSISHRAIMLAALAEGTSHISGFLESEDTLATVNAFRKMGVRMKRVAFGEWRVYGVGIGGLNPPDGPIDCGNAGTCMRLLSGILAGQCFDSTLIGDASLSRRPMQRVIDPLMQMGAQIDAAENGAPPLHIYGRRTLQGITYHMPIASAQVKSAVLLAGLYASGQTCVIEPQPTRDYTEKMLANFGWPITVDAGRVTLTGGDRLCATDMHIPADFSSAAFFIVAASIVPGSELILRNVGMNPRRTGLLSVLRQMGADIRQQNERYLQGDPVADLIVRHAPLRGIEVPEAVVPDMIDEFPILFVAAAVACGTMVIRGATELRMKESDRIAVMARALRILGVAIKEMDDGVVIEGGILRGGEVDSAGDHRCAMSLAIAGQVAREPVYINDCANAATSFPGFVELAQGGGLALRAHSR